MKISIIGNGKLSKNYGKQIDKCDLVIRFNKAKVKGYEKKVGTKTDILSIVGETSLSYTNAAYKLDRYVLQNVNKIWFTGLKRNEGYEALLNKLHEKTNKLIGGIYIGIDYDYINYDCYIYLCKEINNKFEMIKYPSTGINTICYCLYNYNILNSKTNKMSIYGFDCFKSGHYFDNEKRNNNEFHDLDNEKKVLDYLKQFNNIKFYN